MGIQLTSFASAVLRGTPEEKELGGKERGRRGKRGPGRREGRREGGRKVKHNVKLYTSAAHLHIRSTTHMHTIPGHGLPIQPGNVGQSLLPDAPLGREGEKG